MPRKTTVYLAPFGNKLADNLLSSITAGLIVGTILTFLNVSMAALIFKGPLAPYLGNGISLVLSGTVVLMLATAMLTSLTSAVCVVQEVPVGILAVVAADIAYTMRGSNPDQLYATVLGAIVFATALTALTFWLLGHFRLGQLIRFVPYPVIGGFLAGTGWLLVTGAVGVMTKRALSMELLAPALLAHWFPGLLLGLLIFFTLRHTAHFLALPALILGAIALFYMVLVGMGYTPADALTTGWLLGPLPAGQLWKPGALAVLSEAAWPLIFVGHGASLAAIPFMSVLALLLNTGALEVALRRDADINQELRTGGIANGLAMLVGSPPGFVAVTESALGERLGGGGRVFSVVIALVSVVILLLGAAFLAYIPQLVVGGLLAFLGFVFLAEWLYDAWFKLAKLDNLLIWLITIVIGLFGFLAGVAIGILVAMVLFVINYSQVDALRHLYSRADYPSYVSRPRVHEQWLQGCGQRIVIAELQGYLFFGTAHRLLQELRERLAQRDIPTIDFIVLDFRLVTGMDSSVTSSFLRFLRYLDTNQTHLVLTTLASPLQRVWVRELSSEMTLPTPHLFPTLDQGLAWCEEVLLQEQTGPNMMELDDVSTQQPASFTFVEMVLESLSHRAEFSASLDLEPLQARLRRLTVNAGDLIVEEGAQLDGIFYIEEGELMAQTKTSDGHTVVMRRMQQGAIFGEISLYTTGYASADVVAFQSGTLTHLSQQALHELEFIAPPLALVIHHLIARDLSHKLIQSTHGLSVLKR